MSWKDSFREGKEIFLCTCYKNKPNANIVVSLGVIDNKLIVADCQMKNTIRNLRKNKKICVIGGYYRIIGEAEIYGSGKYFDACVKKSKGYNVRHAIMIKISEVFDLDTGKTVL